MDIRRDLSGSRTSGIIRLLVTVGIIGAAYLLIVKPALETTNQDVTRIERCTLRY